MNNELSGEDNGFKEWNEGLKNMSDLEMTYAVRDRILNHSDIDKESLELFDISFLYCMKLIQQHKPLESNLLKIYLKDVHHKDVNQIDMVTLILLLGICGINFSDKQ